MAFITHFRPRRCLRPPFSWHQAFYHDYVRCATPGDEHSFGERLRCSLIIPGGTVRVPLSSPKVIGIANSRGER
jgi:hypothetical protein